MGIAGFADRKFAAYADRPITVCCRFVHVAFVLGSGVTHCRVQHFQWCDRALPSQPAQNQIASLSPTLTRAIDMTRLVFRKTRWKAEQEPGLSATVVDRRQRYG